MTEVTLRPIDGNGHVPDAPKPYFWQIDHFKDDPDAPPWREGIDVMLLAITRDVEVIIGWLTNGLDRGDKYAWIVGMMALKDFSDNMPIQHSFSTIANGHENEAGASRRIRSGQVPE
jgi:hypothetical protein